MSNSKQKVWTTANSTFEILADMALLACKETGVCGPCWYGKENLPPTGMPHRVAHFLACKFANGFTSGRFALLWGRKLPGTLSERYPSLDDTYSSPTVERVSWDDSERYSEVLRDPDSLALAVGEAAYLLHEESTTPDQ